MDCVQVTDGRGQLNKWVMIGSIGVREVFWVSNVPTGLTRGKHAHRRCTQTIILLKGKMDVLLEDKDKTQTISMGGTNTILEIPPMTWSQQTFLDNDTEIVVLCSELYDEDEYIRDYLEFREAIGAN